ncbi:hypothetical protein JCM10212_003594 [Sporobolomyces blumeae]
MPARLLRSIASMLPFTAPSDQRSAPQYIALPRLSTTVGAFLPGSGPTSPKSAQASDDDEKQLHHLANLASVPVHQRRGALVAIWIYLSPFVVAALTVYAYLYTTPPGADRIVDHYACAPRSNFTSLTEACKVGDEPVVENLNQYDLTLDRHLNHEQCDIVFPGLFEEIYRARDFWKERGGVTKKDLDDAQERGQARALIYNNRLYVSWSGGWQQGTRTKATLALINEALTTATEPVPDIEFVLQTGDNGIVQGAPWSLSRRLTEPQLTLMPDYSFYSWPEPGVNSFQEVADNCKIYESKLKWKNKINKLFWRGAFMVDIRKEFAEISSKYKWGAVEDLNWLDREEVNKKLITPEDHCQYKFLGHAEGYAYSGRLKYLMQCRSVIVAHEQQFTQHFHVKINDDPRSPAQNLVTVPGGDFARLPEVMEDLLKDDEKAKRIAQNSYDHWRHWLSPASIDCYWRRLFREWAELQTFTPVLTKDHTSWNSFSLMDKVHWDPF